MSYALRLILVVCLCGVTIRSTDAQRRLDPAAEWETLGGCRLLEGWGNDGDSFRVEHQGRAYIFRLYFVDTPEAGTRYPDRVKRQAAYFGITESASVELGMEASEFTEGLLQPGFKIVTRWQNAKGNADLPRFFAAVFVEGKDLAGLLVENGYACRMGAPAFYPSGMEAEAYRHHLHDLEVEAKKARRGAWADRWPTPPVPGPAPDPVAGDAAQAYQEIDLNAAKPVELKRVPGISPGMVESIMRNRPFEKVDDLLRVSSIRLATLEQIRPHVTVNVPDVTEP